MKTTEAIFRRYEEIKHRLPAFEFERDVDLNSRRVGDLGAIDSEIDLFLFDAFGVLNVGETVISGAPDRVRLLQEKGKLTYILTNAASYQKPALVEKFLRLGFNISAEDIVSSREVLISHLVDQIKISTYSINQLGVISISSLEDLPSDLNCVLFDSADGLANEEFWASDAFLFLSSGEWTDDHQQAFVDQLKDNPKPVFVGNPDVVAPRETTITREPGYFAHDIMDRTSAPVQFFGKPFGNAYQAAIARAKQQKPDLSLDRCLMVGDTLHTDILGGAAAGIKTALVTDHGTYAGSDVEPYIHKSAIIPDYILPSV